jgi:hypothetical protein
VLLKSTNLVAEKRDMLLLETARVYAAWETLGLVILQEGTDLSHECKLPLMELSCSRRNVPHF